MSPMCWCNGENILLYIVSLTGSDLHQKQRTGFHTCPVLLNLILCKQMGHGNNRGTEKYHLALSKDGRGLLREKLNTL